MYSNFRGITLLSLPGKVYSGVLERRVRRIVEPRIQEEQCGFRPGRGTVDQLYTLCRILEGAWEFAQPVHMCFVDLEKAFIKWLGHLVRMPPGRLPGEVFRARPTGRRPRGRPRTRWRDFVSRLAWEHLGIPQEELDKVAGEREVWASLLTPDFHQGRERRVTAASRYGCVLCPAPISTGHVTAAWRCEAAGFAGSCKNYKTPQESGDHAIICGCQYRTNK